MSKKRVAIVCGGASSEHEISCISARGVLGAINRELFEPILIGITRNGTWLILSEDSAFGTGSNELPEVPEAETNLLISSSGIFDRSGKRIEVDIFFPILHGAYGEDGTIQGLFEMIGIPYVGSGVLASSVAMDKSFAKSIYADFGLSITEGVTVHSREWEGVPDEVIRRIEPLGYPLFIKPARSGSSRGTTKVKSAADLAAAFTLAFEHDPRALVEKAISGREIECAVLEIAGNPQASVLGEIKVQPPHEFYDFEAKYLDGSTTFEYPAKLSSEKTEEIQRAAVLAFMALGCEGLARVDFFLTESGELIINELNTMPGFTPRSVFPMLWAASGKSYQEIITLLCNAALSRPRSVIR